MNATTLRLVSLQRALVDAESKLRLLDSLMPQNFRAEHARLVESFARGRPTLPEFRFANETDRLARADAVSVMLSAARLLVGDPGFAGDLPPGLAVLLSDRLDELSLEVRMIRECGKPGFRTLAALRFGLTDAELARSTELARNWSEVEDEQGPASSEVLLASFFERKRREMGLIGRAFFVTERDIASTCAVGGRYLYVRKGARVSQGEAERLWVHEVGGHLLPRLRSEELPPPFSIGTPGCAVDEEGWAIHLEERHGLLSAVRKKELGSRFQLASALRQLGPEGVSKQLEIHLALRGEPAVLATTMCRIFRGGGLARESIYLPGYLRVRDALKADPSEARYFEMGRASVVALPFFRAAFAKAG